jgi:hypothetical protein
LSSGTIATNSTFTLYGILWGIIDKWLLEV